MDTPHDAAHSGAVWQINVMKKQSKNIYSTQPGQQWSVIDAAHIRLPELTCSLSQPAVFRVRL